jgi:hypothetical protein
MPLRLDLALVAEPREACLGVAQALRLVQEREPSPAFKASGLPSQIAARRAPSAHMTSSSQRLRQGVNGLSRPQRGKTHAVTAVSMLQAWSSSHPVLCEH